MSYTVKEADDSGGEMAVDADDLIVRLAKN
jgi:hypothetical protein